MTRPRTPLDDVASVLDAELGDRVRHGVPLGPMTTYRVGGPARFFLEAESLDELAAVARARRRVELPILIIGRGSNMLVADSGFPGLVLSLERLTGHLMIPTGSDDRSRVDRIVTAGSAVALPVVARRTAAAGLAGFEWAVGVPGSIGGAVRMNAGGHGSDIASSLVDVVVVDLDREMPVPETMGVEALGLRFRASSFAQSMVVLEVRLALRPGDRAASEALITDIVRWRREHQPGGQNCGSVFVNPVPGELAAGALIDSLGLRGLRIGSAWVSEKHANFVQAAEGGSSADVRAVIEAVRARVAAATGHHLRSEVRLVGFDDVDPTGFDDGVPHEGTCR
ncbi:MAG: UDP-N-acetylmuramate dehydrogenase [Actinomycetota bacterium]|jgi:UDP-N-acetylmuramate dehydrogenase